MRMDRNQEQELRWLVPMVSVMVVTATLQRAERTALVWGSQEQMHRQGDPRSKRSPRREMLWTPSRGPGRNITVGSFASSAPLCPIPLGGRAEVSGLIPVPGHQWWLIQAHQSALKTPLPSLSHHPFPIVSCRSHPLFAPFPSLVPFPSLQASTVPSPSSPIRSPLVLPEVQLPECFAARLQWNLSVESNHAALRKLASRPTSKGQEMRPSPFQALPRKMMGRWNHRIAAAVREHCITG